MDIKICVPSYKRPDRVDVLKYLPSALIYVAESEAEAYRRNYGDSIVAVPDKFQGNICRIRSKIMDDNQDGIS